MEMDCNLKTLANVFKLLPSVLEKLQKTFLWCILTITQQNLHDNAPLNTQLGPSHTQTLHIYF